MSFSNFLGLFDLEEEFSAPSTWTTDDEMYAFLGAMFYLIGGVAGAGGLGTSRVGPAMAKQGVAKAAEARQRAQDVVDVLAPGKKKAELQERLDDTIDNADEMLEEALKSKKSLT